jgi:hypothetical protein
MLFKKNSGTHSSRRINVLLERLACKKYLEVGVAEGSTFFAVSTAVDKTAVDPRFRFDAAPLKNATTHFFEMPSDDYFTALPRGTQFDLMFIDGLHTFEQTFRDFCNSLSCCHPRTAWIIDDTLPNDIYSAWPQQTEAVNLRKEEHGGNDMSWHGDVFKLVFAIHDFFPMFSYATINTEGNPQTLVWHEPRKGFKPLYNSLDAISRMSYFDLKKHAHVMNFMTEADALALAVKKLA